MGHLGTPQYRGSAPLAQPIGGGPSTVVAPMLVLSLAAYAASPQLVDAGALGHVGEQVGGGEIARIEQHPEYERYWLRGADGRELAVEVVLSDGVNAGLCEASGVTLFPRPELSEGDPADVDAAAFCERLSRNPPKLGRVAIAPTPAVSPVVEAVERTASRLWTRLVVMAVATLGLVAVALTAFRARRSLTWGFGVPVVIAMALATRPGALFNGAGAGYEKLIGAWGLEHRGPYGEGFAVVMAPAVELWGTTLDAVFWTNAALGVLTVAGVWALARGESTPRVATAAALIYALLPVALRLQASEAMHVSVTACVVGALALAARFRRTGEQVAGFGAAALAGVAINTRPEAMPLVVVVMVWGWRRSGWAPLLLLIAAVVGRLVGFPSDQGVLHWREFVDPGVLVKALLPRIGAATKSSAFQVFWHAALTPVALWPLVVLGARGLDRDLRNRLLVWVVLLGGPVVIKVWPLADAIRLQLPVQAAWVFVAAIGATRAPRWALPVVLGLMFPWIVQTPRWPQAQELDFLREVVPKLGPETVRYDTTPPRAEKFKDVMELLGPARWTGGEAPLRYVGLTCYLGPTPPGCERTECPVFETVLHPPSDLDVQLPDEGVPIGFYRTCP